MDFTTTIEDATKRTILGNAISRREEQIWSDSWFIGINPDDLPSDYTAPAEDPTPGETDMEASLAVLAELKTQLAAL